MVSRFVPEYKPAADAVFKRFKEELSNVEKFVVLTGAGVSTESGIPDYRSEKVGLYERTNHRPMTHQEFMKSHRGRQRYWARNFLAWPKFSSAKCNPNHYAIASWERSDRFSWLITQNVDGLHTEAGSSMVTELHGCGHRMKCTNCGHPMERHDFQEKLASANPGWADKTLTGEMAPDGDIYIEPGLEETFNVPSCSKCDGILKTDVVFFGDNVPRSTVDFIYDKIDNSDGILILGSSLSVMSGYRFAYHAHLQHKPVLIVNIGPTRADHLATVKVSTLVSDVITKI